MLQTFERYSLYTWHYCLFCAWLEQFLMFSLNATIKSQIRSGWNPLPFQGLTRQISKYWQNNRDIQRNLYWFRALTELTE